MSIAVEIDHLFGRTPLNAGEALHGEKKLPVGLGIVARPAAVPVAAIPSEAGVIAKAGPGKLRLFVALVGRNAVAAPFTVLESLRLEGEQTYAGHYEEKHHRNPWQQPHECLNQREEYQNADAISNPGERSQRKCRDAESNLFLSITGANRDQQRTDARAEAPVAQAHCAGTFKRTAMGIV